MFDWSVAHMTDWSPAKCYVKTVGKKAKKYAIMFNKPSKIIQFY